MTDRHSLSRKVAEACGHREGQRSLPGSRRATAQVSLPQADPVTIQDICGRTIQNVNAVHVWSNIPAVRRCSRRVPGPWGACSGGGDAGPASAKSGNTEFSRRSQVRAASVPRSGAVSGVPLFRQILGLIQVRNARSHFGDLSPASCIKAA